MGDTEDLTMEVTTGMEPEEVTLGFRSVGIVIGLGNGHSIKLQSQDAEPAEIVAVLDMVSDAMKKAYDL